MTHQEYEQMSRYLAINSPFYLSPQHGWRLRWAFWWLPFACMVWFLMVPDYQIGWTAIKAPPVGVAVTYEAFSAQTQCGDACQPAVGVLSVVMWMTVAAVIWIFVTEIRNFLTAARQARSLPLWRWLPMLERSAFASCVFPALITLDSKIGPHILVHYASYVTKLAFIMQLVMTAFVAAIFVLSVYVDKKVRDNVHEKA